MVFRQMKKGDLYHFSNFPEINMSIIVSGRMQINWFDATVTDDISENNEEQTLYIYDFLDS